MRYVDHALRDMKENGEEAALERHSFILELYKELNDPILVRDQLMNVLIIGRDTTACLLSWALYLSFNLRFQFNLASYMKSLAFINSSPAISWFATRRLSNAYSEKSASRVKLGSP